MSTAHEKSVKQDEKLKEERKNQEDPAPKRNNRKVAD
jgi:hypothetical protein